ncbi:MAG: PASTA domain-containing protein, partial [Solirubrobacteraceae bacterium]
RARRRAAALLAAALLLLAAAAAVALALLLPAQAHIVPNVEGKRESTARAILGHEHFEVFVERASSANVRAGYVVSETPRAGSRGKRGSPVTLVVSSGRGSSKVPSVAGRSEHEAEEALKEANLRARPTHRTSETVPAGTAIGTEPKTGIPVTSGTEVTLIVSSGPAKVRVPRLLEETRPEAEATLEGAGLAVGKVRYERDGSAAPETVVTQVPGADSLLLAHTPVDLVVASAPAKPSKVHVPSLLEETRPEAEASLAREGLSAHVAQAPAAEAAEAGRVVRQNPAPGTEAVKKSTVTIYVGKLLSSSTTKTETTTDTTGTQSSTSSTSSTNAAAPPGG